MAGFMDHPEGAGAKRGDRVDFDRRVRLEFQGTQFSSDGGLLVVRERWMMRPVCPIPGLVPCAIAVWARTHRPPARRPVPAVDARAASASQMGRFETDTLALPGNRAALATARLDGVAVIGAVEPGKGGGRRNPGGGFAHLQEPARFQRDIKFGRVEPGHQIPG